MTREKAIEILKRKTTIPNDGEDFDYISEAFDIAIKALEEPCEDCISRQDAIKKVSEILKGVFVEYEDIAQKAIGSLPTVNPQPCEDAISREDALMALTGEWTEPTDELIHRFIRRIKKLPSVTPQPKTGQWIPQDIHNCHTNFRCSKCGYIHSFMHLYGNSDRGRAMKGITERQVIATWYTLEEKLPPEDQHVLVTVSGRDGNCIYDHALQIASWMDDDIGWLVEGFSDDAQFTVHAWCDIDPYGGG